MERRVKLTRSASTQVTMTNYGAYRLRVEITAVEGPDLDENLFIYRRNPPSPYNGLNRDTFEAVCGPPQLATYPAGEPDPDIAWPYYRSNTIELDVASTQQADAIWQEIQAEICMLVAALNRLDSLTVLEETWCPSPPTDTSLSAGA